LPRRAQRLWPVLAGCDTDSTFPRRRGQERHRNAKGAKDAFDDTSAPTERESANRALAGPWADVFDECLACVPLGDELSEQRCVDGRAVFGPVAQHRHVGDLDEAAVPVDEREAAGDA
jgi:hypothetical protein